MLKETVIAALEAHFGAEVILTPSSREFASFDAKHPDVGKVVIEDDGKELTVWVGNIHHGQFASFEDGLSEAEHEAVIVDQLIGFLVDLFADNYLLFKARWGGGWTPVEEVADSKLRSRYRQWFKWSGPIDFNKNPN